MYNQFQFHLLVGSLDSIGKPTVTHTHTRAHTHTHTHTHNQVIATLSCSRRHSLAMVGEGVREKGEGEAGGWIVGLPDTLHRHRGVIPEALRYVGWRVSYTTVEPLYKDT